ncbi:MAG: ABC transporter ATP-binding protein [Desulfobacteraceae bacterium]|jgi:peptide/nickel transport system ATP-binding protein/oligopeptide transport system ATP-binding protein|nr:ABC transporter ATP-binding protein [Desulfobacteraceae bacterium]
MKTDTLLLQVEDLHTVFYTDAGVVRAVNGVEFALAPKQILGLVGESGCGKTVTGLSILGLIPQPPGRIEQGRIVFEGTDLLTLSDKAMRRIRGNRIAMIFQEPMTSLNPIFTVGYQIREVLRIHRQVSKDQANGLTVEMLQKVGLPDPDKRMHEYPHQMSGGMRQRVMIAMALCCSPRLIIADEPTTALDVTIQAQILELIQRLRVDTGTAILLITHDLGVIAEMADTVAVMYAGRIVEHAPCDDLFDNPCHPYTLGLMQSIPQIDQPLTVTKSLQTIAGVVPSLLDLPAGCAFRERCNRVMTKCRQDPPFFPITDGHRVRCWLHER